MDISEIGKSIQMRVLVEDAEILKKHKLAPEEPWYKVIHRVLIEHANLKKQLKKEANTEVNNNG